jgi:hypothetical protein
LQGASHRAGVGDVVALVARPPILEAQADLVAEQGFDVAQQQAQADRVGPAAAQIERPSADPSIRRQAWT